MAIEDLIQKEWVLLPGTLCTAEVFDEFLDALGVPVSRRHPMLLEHLSVDDYDELVDMSRDAVVCGFSLGAIVAAHRADTLDAAALVLIGLNPYPDDPARAEGRHALAKDVLLQGGAAALKPRLPELYGPEPEVARQKILSMAESSAWMIEPQTHLALSRAGALKTLSKSRCPVLALTGERDVLAPPEQGMAAAEQAPFGRFQILSGLGHYALVEDPVACAATLIGMEVAD